MRKPTIYEALRHKLGREPTNAELKADVQRIKRDALVEVASRGGLPHQRASRRKRRGLAGSKEHHRAIFEGHIGEAETHMRNARYAIAGGSCERAYTNLTKMWGSLGIAKTNAVEAKQLLRYEGRVGRIGFRDTTHEFVSACMRPKASLEGPRLRRKRRR